MQTTIHVYVIIILPPIAAENVNSLHKQLYYSIVWIVTVAVVWKNITFCTLYSCMEINSAHFKRAFFFTLQDLDSDDEPYSRNINRKIEPKLKIYKKIPPDLHWHSILLIHIILENMTSIADACKSNCSNFMCPVWFKHTC